MRFPTFLALIPLLFLSIACSSLERPTATVRGAQLGEITADGLTLNLDVLLSNPNPVEIPLTKTGYSLSLAGTKVLDGTAEPKTSIPAKGNAPVTLPIQLKWAELIKAKDAIISSGGDIPYSVDGKLGIGGGIPLIGEHSIPLNYSGTLPLREALRNPATLMKNPLARELATELLKGRFKL